MNEEVYRRNTKLRQLFNGAVTWIGLAAAIYTAAGYLRITYEILAKIIAVVLAISFGVMAYRIYDQEKHLLHPAKSTRKQKLKRYGIILLCLIVLLLVYFHPLLTLWIKPGLVWILVVVILRFAHHDRLFLNPTGVK